MKNRECAFCGSSPTSGEHVFPDWLHQHVGVIEPTSSQVLTHMAMSDSEPKIIARDMNRVLTTKKIHWFCEPCNTGWMADLERRAKPILLPLIDGERRLLSLAEQRVIAAWTYLKAVVVAFDTPEHVGPRPAQRRWFMRHQVPVPGSFVQGFKYDLSAQGKEMRFSYWHAGVAWAASPERHVRYWSVLLVMQNLCLHTCGGPLMGPMELRPQFLDSAHLWPSAGVEIQWPLDESCADEELVDRMSYQGPLWVARG